MLEGKVDNQGKVDIQGIDYHPDTLPVDVPAIVTVYGTLLNFKGSYEELASSMNEKPYKEPPKAPILYIKPKNTFISNRQAIPLPEDIAELEMGATLGI